MKLIIDIDDNDYGFIKDLHSLIIGGRGNCKTIQYNVINAVKNGKPISNDGDLISRSDLNQAINKIVDEEIGIDEKWAKGLKYSLKLIDNAPAITPKLPTEVRKALEVLDKIEQNRWVPVSERLPEENVLDDGYHEPSKWVLVQARNGHMYTTRYWTRDKKNVWTDLEYPDDIIAWQELPKTYKEDNAE